MARLDHRSAWDLDQVLKNPHKGWHHHFWDDGLDRYGAESDEELLDFPGMDHLYLRFAWAFLEPEKGDFRWEMVDQMVEKWVPKGLNLAFRITARETHLEYATPKWVEAEGCPGEWFENWGKTTWAPTYDHPIFLKHLEEFHQAFGERYAGQPWLEYVDVGSFGDWGEGHTSFSQRRDFDFDAMVKHLQIHRDCYPTDLVAVSDDFAHDRRDGREQEMARIVDDMGFTWRDDSILVRYWVDARPETASVHRPEYFQKAAKRVPTILELQHYHEMKDPNLDNTWQGEEGSVFGADVFRRAIELMQASWIGHHGYARVWLADNPRLTKELGNRCGYWLIPHQTELPDKGVIGEEVELRVVLENRGVAPYTRPGSALLILEGASRAEIPCTTTGLGDTSPGGPRESRFRFRLPVGLPVGAYRASLRFEATKQGRRVALAVKGDGDLPLGSIDLAP
jgi:hypothetical protein